MDNLQINDLVKGKVIQISTYGIFILLDNGLKTLCHNTDISYNKVKAKDLYQVGDKVQAKVTNIDKSKKPYKCEYQSIKPKSLYAIF
ncbi:30S ribosomal protein S1 [Phocoenobacter uteri]|uniref:30S ribosomal protein S1 n=1 Tax=Phocoenobacter uteri TaxID=146806 RepID=A0A379CBM7_9PAST|nr:S1 RNA-binding domain-containing protein [Phocoenobacter uteri]MDG6881084.1 hypothetical protein [Phocoenobacter uteri]SUB59106.1 30S ribosomal protein S1 [Phocoenobacter uteri]